MATFKQVAGEEMGKNTKPALLEQAAANGKSLDALTEDFKGVFCAMCKDKPRGL